MSLHGLSYMLCQHRHTVDCRESFKPTSWGGGTTAPGRARVTTRRTEAKKPIRMARVTGNINRSYGCQLSSTISQKSLGNKSLCSWILQVNHSYMSPRSICVYMTNSKYVGSKRTCDGERVAQEHTASQDERPQQLGQPCTNE